MNYFQIKRKLIPVLKKGEQFNFEKAKVEVKTFIASLMILDENEKTFVNKFRAKIYEPHLLFEDKEILERNFRENNKPSNGNLEMYSKVGRSMT